jgi:LPS-assembly protein
LLTAASLRAAALAAATLGMGLLACPAWGQGTGVKLRASPQLQENLSPQENTHSAVYSTAERMVARPDMDLVLEGKAEIRKAGMSIKAERIDYDQTQDVVEAKGQVRINRLGNVFEGPRLRLQVDSFSGAFEQPRFELVQSQGYGTAERIDFVDTNRMVARQSRYTTCRRQPGPEWLPEWLLKAASLSTDNEESTGRAEGVQLEFMGLSTPALPAVSFALTDERKSGFLAPLYGVDTLNGIDLMQPYYWNIAPNRDATITPRIMTQRGTAVETDFRYLEDSYSGQAKLNYMPSDSLRQQARWGLSTLHNGQLDTGVASVGRIGLGLSLNRVSDDNYWRDFPRSGTGSTLALTQRLLPSTGSVSWDRGDFSMMLRIQRWQALQDVSSPITPPYDRAPQLTMRYGQWDPTGFDWSVTADTTRFEANYTRIPNNTAVAMNGERSYVLSQISHPWVRPWGFFTPKLQLHATRYQLDQAMSDGATVTNRVLPTWSLDSGLTFERNASWFGRDMLQTLEPRVFYARTPYRRQDALPVYDTGIADFNLSTIYSENPYVGQDRMVDNNALTMGVNTRFFDAGNGAELLRLGMAQRIRFANQQVTLPGQAADSAGISDLLLGAGMRWDERWGVDSLVQINPQTNTVSRATLQTRYNPSPYRLLNLAYRVNRNVSAGSSASELLDVGWQWPMSSFTWGDKPDDSGVRKGGQGLGADRWYAVGRMNFSVPDRKLVDTLVGFEYDAGCWLGRVVLERLQSTVTTSSARLLFQLEFVGLARVGSSPLQSLKNNIPRYQYLRDDKSTTSRFLQYE